MEKETVLGSLARFQSDRGLDKQPFDLRVASINIIEELLEAHGVSDSDDRDCARYLYKFLEHEVEAAEKGHQVDGVTFTEPTVDDLVDAFCDIEVFGGGEVGKLGYNNEACLAEVSKEINSRAGEMKDGKFTKFKTEEAMANWYKANFTKCKEV